MAGVGGWAGRPGLQLGCEHGEAAQSGSASVSGVCEGFEGVQGFWGVCEGAAAPAPRSGWAVAELGWLCETVWSLVLTQGLFLQG